MHDTHQARHHGCGNLPIHSEQELHGFVGQLRNLAEDVWNFEYFVEVLVSAFLSQQKQLFQLLHIKRSHATGVFRSEDRLGSRESTDHGEVHAADNQARVDAKPGGVADNDHAVAMELLGDAAITNFGHEVRAVLDGSPSVEERMNRRMHFEILQNVLNVPALFGRLSRVENNPE